MAYPAAKAAGEQVTAQDFNDYALNPAYTYGETITAGQALYLKNSDGKVYKASAATQAHVDGFVGVALESGVANDAKRIIPPGKVMTGLSGLTAGGVVFLQDTAGGLGMSRGTISIRVGVAISSTAMLVLSNVEDVNLDQLGDGSDGVVDFNGTLTFASFATKSGSTYTLTRPVYATNVAVQPGVTVELAGNFICARGVFNNSGTVHANGGAGGAGGNASGDTAGTAGTAGAAVAAGFFPAGKAGKAGGVGGAGVLGTALGSATGLPGTAGTAGDSTTRAIQTASAVAGGAAGNGGHSGSGGNGGAAGTNTSTPVKPPNSIRNLLTFAEFVAGVFTQYAIAPSGGGGGGGGGGGYSKASTGTYNSGGGGGGGGSGAPGGVCAVLAFILTGSGTFSANGGNGGNGGTGANGSYASSGNAADYADGGGSGGGGAPGNGGRVFLASHADLFSGTAQANAGTAGKKGATAGTASGGANGQNGTLGNDAAAGTAGTVTRFTF